jgi:hypothetical protein
MNSERAPKSDRALQILQTILLTTLLGVGGWNLLTTVETQKSMATLTESLNIRSHQIDAMADEIRGLHASDNQLDRRVTTLEATTPKRIQ